MVSQRALWASTSTSTKGGIASYVRSVAQTQLWTDWNIRHIATHRDGSSWAKIAAFARGGVMFVFALMTFRPTVVHLHTSSGASFIRKTILFWISRLAGVPTVMHVHGSAFHEYVANSPWLIQVIVRATFNRASAVVALGQTWAGRLQEIAPGARIVIIPNAVQPASATLGRDPEQPVGVAFLGRIGDRKGTFRLLDAWAALDTRNATLTIAGDGEVDRARRRIAELHLEDTVRLHGWLPPDSVQELLDDTQVLVLPSRNEGQPMAVLEAMARGLCVVAGDAGGLPEMVGDGCGVLVPPDDVAAIAEVLRRVLGDSALRAECGAAAYARVQERYDVRAVARRLDELYREVAR